MGRRAAVHPGDGRLHAELRKYADIGGRMGGNHLFVVDAKEARYIDCNNLTPALFGPEFIADVANRTHVRRRTRRQCLLAAELVVQRADGGRRHAEIEG